MTFFRDDIHVLRAVGVVLVVTYHVWVGRPSGGVDVFILISAFLVTQSFFRNNLFGAIKSTLRFWGRLCVNLFPSAFIVIFITLLWDYSTNREIFYLLGPRDAIAALFQFENIALMRSGVDYNDLSRFPSAFQHYWALSLLVQFYVILPIFILGAALLSQFALQGKHRTKITFVLCICLMALSFGYALYATGNDPAAAYFDPLTRLWEFLAGVLCVGLISRTRVGDRVRALLSWLGFLMIVLTGMIIPGSWHFPGIAALFPVFGAALIIVCGSKPSAYDVGHLLKSPFFTRVADLAFGVYLWHWPILIILMEPSNGRIVNISTGVYVVLLSVALAFVTNSLVGTPLRRLYVEFMRSNRADKKKLAFPFVVSIAFAFPAAALLVTYVGNYTAEWQSEDINISSPIHGTDRLLRLDRSVIGWGYPHQRDCMSTDSTLKMCKFESIAENAPTMVLLGASHVFQWLPAFQEIARHFPLRIVVLSKGGCRLNGYQRNAGQKIGEATKVDECESWVEKAFDKLRELKPEVVFTTATVIQDSNEGDSVPEGYEQIFRKLSDVARYVILIRDTPIISSANKSTMHCVLRHPNHLEICGSIKTMKEKLDIEKAVGPLDKNVFYIDLTDHICGAAFCPAVLNDTIVYYDGEHLSARFARSLSLVMEEKISLAVPILFGDRKKGDIFGSGAAR